MALKQNVGRIVIGALGVTTFIFPVAGKTAEDTLLGREERNAASLS